MTATKFRWLSDYVKAAIEVSHVRELKPNTFNVLKEQMDKVPHPAMVYTNITPLVKAAKETKFECNTKVFKKVLYYALLSRPEVDIETCFVKQLGKKSIDQVVVENILYISRYLFPAQRFEKEVFETEDNITNLTRQLQHEFAVEKCLDQAFYWKIPDNTPIVHVLNVSDKVYKTTQKSSILKRVRTTPLNKSLLTFKAKKEAWYRVPIGNFDKSKWVRVTPDAFEVSVGYQKVKPISKVRFSKLTRLMNFDYPDNTKLKYQRDKLKQELAWYLTMKDIVTDEYLKIIFSKDTNQLGFEQLFEGFKELGLVGRNPYFKAYVTNYLEEALSTVMDSFSTSDVQKLTIIKKYKNEFLKTRDNVNTVDNFITEYVKYLIAHASARDIINVFILAVHLLKEPKVTYYGRIMDDVAVIDVETSDDGSFVYSDPKVVYEPGESRSDSDNFEAVYSEPKVIYGPDQLAAMSTEEMIQKDLIHIKIYD
jgi:hypothetical protein